MPLTAKTQLINTPRLTLRPFSESDSAKFFQNWGCDEAVARYLTRRAHLNADETAGWIARWLPLYANPGFFLWCVEYAGEPIGTINLHDVSEDDLSCDMGYSIGSRWWGLGLATEAASAVRDFAFESAGMHRLTAWIADGNAASGRVLEKLGMQYEGRSRQSMRARNGGFVDQLHYAILRSEWQAIVQNPYSSPSAFYLINAFFPES